MGMTIAIDKLYMNKMPKSCKECPLTYLDSGDDAYFGSNERRCVIDDSCVVGMASERAYDCPLVEAIPKADYENRLKADLVAMLTEIQLEIEEIKPLKPTDDEDWQYGCFHGLELMQDKCLKLIQQKINSLEEAKDGKNNY